MYSCRSRPKPTIPRRSAAREQRYWDYTQLRFPRREGMRIDFVLGSPALAALAARVTGALIDREERKGKGASDHAPVIVDLADQTT
jgi:exodeoxyribonuclease-3